VTSQHLPYYQSFRKDLSRWADLAERQILGKSIAILLVPFEILELLVIKR